MKKINWKNLIKLIIMDICMVIVMGDIVNVFVGIIFGISIGFTLYGIIIDTLLVILGCIIYEELFGEDYE